MTTTMGRHADTLRLIALRLGLPELRDVVRQPGISEAYRLTIQYHDQRHPDQVATLTHAQHDGVLLTVVYRRARYQPTLEYPLDLDRYQVIDLGLRRLGFDRRDDQPDVPYIGQDMWLMERASGSFSHDIVLAPGLAGGVYSWMVDVIREHLPQAIRAIQPDW